MIETMLDEAKAYLIDAIEAYQGQKLSLVQLQVLEGILNGATYDEIAQKTEKTAIYIGKHIGPDLIRAANQAIKPSKKFTKRNLKERISTLRLEEHKEAVTHPITRKIYGRDKEIRLLRQWSQECRIIFLVGLPGIGKTCLAAKFLDSTENSFRKIWQLVQSTTDLLSITENQVPGDKGSLIVLDEADEIISNAECKLLFKKILTSNHNSSCLILTTRVLPTWVEEFQFRQMPIGVCNVQGLDTESAKQIFFEHGLYSSNDNLEILAKALGCQPLLLVAAATAIAEQLDGNVDCYLQKGTVGLSLVENYIEQQMSLISREEYQALREIAQIPQPKAPQEIWAASPSPLKTLQKLTRYALLIRQKDQSDKELLEIPPVIKRFLIRPNS